MRGLPDSAVYGSYKRLKRTGRKTRSQEHGGDFFEFVYWVIYFVRWAKARWSR